MNDLRLSASGYAAQRRRSPSALAGALAINGGVFALILLLPATQYLMHPEPPLVIHDVPLSQDPPPNRPDPVDAKKPIPTQTKVETPLPQPYVPPQVIPLGGDSVVGGGTIPDLGDIGRIADLNPPLNLPHQVIFRAATRDPRYASAFHPDYPPALRRQELEGSVTVRVTIDESGRVTAVEMVKATNRAFFDETREQALRFWRFRPATNDGVPVASQQTLTVQFNLEDE